MHDVIVGVEQLVSRHSESLMCSAPYIFLSMSSVLEGVSPILRGKAG